MTPHPQDTTEVQVGVANGRHIDVVSNTPTTSARDAMPPHLLRIADALKARFNARLTYLATPSYTAGKPPQPAMGDTFTEYRK